MAFSLSQHSLSPPSSTFQIPSKPNLPPLSPHLKLPPFKPHYSTLTLSSTIPKSTPKNQENETQNSDSGEPRTEAFIETTELGEEIKKAMKEREEKGGSDFWSGVGEEIREIEWPPFGKVLGTTGVVLGVIAGSSVVLLTVNAVLAQLSDTVFAGKGVQDFFS